MILRRLRFREITHSTEQPGHYPLSQMFLNSVVPIFLFAEGSDDLLSEDIQKNDS